MRKGRFTEVQIIGMIKEQEAGVTTGSQVRQRLADTSARSIKIGRMSITGLPVRHFP